MDEIIFLQNGRNRRGYLVTCQSCNKEFPVRKNQVGKFCSQECASVTRRQRQEVKCGQCGSVFQKTKSRISASKSGIYFCSRKCKDEAQKIGGIKEIMPSHYGTAKGRELCRQYIARTECPRCCDCEEGRRYLLCVHHIDGNRENNVDENLEVVCWNCHAKRHLKYDSVKNEWVYSSACLTPRDKLCEIGNIL